MPRTRERGHAIKITNWWWNLARARVFYDARSWDQLGKDLAKHVPEKKTRFSGTAINNFALGKTMTTMELVKAICAEYRIPPPLFIPESYVEAVEMMGTRERFAALPKPPADFLASITSIPKEGRRALSKEQRQATNDVLERTTSRRSA